ncbi:MAG: 2-hydroxyhepta-2,4-diene-1,7-dioate isomerase, partial [Rhodobacteraceae bacterium]|nr:2-hydroxyhepta-2,4-diene-1,7-dioate isomerase [Paracoccaceae bacterium]
MTDRIATFRAGGRDRYGLVTEGGLVDLTPEFGAR